MIRAGKQDLLILGCSHRKKEIEGPAKTVYDGPLFRTLRKRSTEINDSIAVLILSAKHGIVRDTDIIAPYDEELSHPVSHDFIELVASQLALLLPSDLQRVLILAPRRYVGALPLETIRSRADEMELMSGRLGKSQALLLQWLGIQYARRVRPSSHLGALSECVAIPEPSRLKTAVDELLNGDHFPHSSVSWYARIGDNVIPAKKLVCSLTKIPVCQFETCHALALLRIYGIETCQVIQE